VITLDSSAIVALLNVSDLDHASVRAAVALERSVVVPALVMAEAAWMVTARAGQGAFLPFLEGIERGQGFLDCGDVDPPRIRALMVRYADLELGFADAAVIACAERNGGRLLTLDRRDFDVVAGEGAITVLP
jgi:uncharacterized protein